MRTIFALLMLATGATAHETATGWTYPWTCCGGYDCALVPAEHVATEPDGYHFRLDKGLHPQVTKPTEIILPYSGWRLSPDGEYHLCLSPKLDVLCVFVPGAGT